MSFDESFLEELLRAMSDASLEGIVIGNAGAVLHGVPLLTQDVDIFVRDHPKLDEKLNRFAEVFQVSLTRPFEPSSRMVRAVGRPLDVDFVFSLSSGASFESIRSRATKVRIGKRTGLVAALDDIIRAKEAANRPKDKAHLQILKEALKVSKEMEKKERKNHR